MGIGQCPNVPYSSTCSTCVLEYGRDLRFSPRFKFLFWRSLGLATWNGLTVVPPAASHAFWSCDPWPISAQSRLSLLRSREATPRSSRGFAASSRPLRTPCPSPLIGGSRTTTHPMETTVASSSSFVRMGFARFYRKFAFPNLF